MKEFVRKSENMEQCIWVIPYIIRGGGISKSNELQVQEGVRLLLIKYCFDFHIDFKHFFSHHARAESENN